MAAISAAAALQGLNDRGDQDAGGSGSDVAEVAERGPARAPRANLRVTLGIPPDAVVFGRHGGRQTFDIEFAQRAVVEVARSRPRDVYFVFLNTEAIAGAEGLENVIHLPAPLVDEASKSSFILACDAMLHARSRGETFGLAVAEFSAHNKPVITSRHHHDGGLARYHLDVLAERALMYDDYESLVALLLGFDRAAAAERGKRGYYSEPYLVPFAPLRVMRTFRKAFLQQADSKK